MQGTNKKNISKPFLGIRHPIFFPFDATTHIIFVPVSMVSFVICRGIIVHRNFLPSWQWQLNKSAILTVETAQHTNSCPFIEYTPRFPPPTGVAGAVFSTSYIDDWNCISFGLVNRAGDALIRIGSSSAVGL